MSTETVFPDANTQPGGSAKKEEDPFWHYTTGERFLQIVADGVIKPATAFIDPGERPIVWFSPNQYWEPTAVKAKLSLDGSIVRLSMEQTREMGRGLFRFGVSIDTQPLDWKQITELSGMSPTTAKSLRKASLLQGARPHLWRGTFEPVPRERWLAVDCFQEGQWVRVANPWRDDKATVI